MRFDLYHGEGGKQLVELITDPQEIMAIATKLQTQDMVELEGPDGDIILVKRKR